MTPCARSCCWVPMAGVCARNRACDCHAPSLTEWLGARPADEPAWRTLWRDPTANKAIRNIENQRRKPR